MPVKKEAPAAAMVVAGDRDSNLSFASVKIDFAEGTYLFSALPLIIQLCVFHCCLLQFPCLQVREDDG